MDPSAISPSGEGPLHQALRAELEATRQAFHALLATLAPADWTRPSLNPAWTIGEVLWHIAGYLFLIPQQLGWLQTGTFPDQSQRSADELNRGNVQQTRAGAKAQTLISIAQAYEEGHALTLAALRRVRDDEWPIGVRMADMGSTFTGEYRTIETLFRYHARHFAEHAAQIPSGGIPMNEAEYVAGIHHSMAPTGWSSSRDALVLESRLSWPNWRSVVISFIPSRDARLSKNNCTLVEMAYRGKTRSNLPSCVYRGPCSSTTRRCQSPSLPYSTARLWTTSRASSD
jgi:uncharacterized protein (TIGR03083 family)